MNGMYKVGDTIEFTYQAKKSVSGLTDVTAEIYDETNVKDIINFPDVVCVEIGTSGRYFGSFTPDEVGVWRITVDSASKSAPQVKQYEVVNHNVESIGDAVEAIGVVVDDLADPSILV